MLPNMPDEDPIEAALAAARLKFPNRKRLYAVDTPAGVLVLGVPPRQKVDAYLALAVSDEKSEKAQASKTLLLACAVDPDELALAAILNGPEGYAALAIYPPLRQKLNVIIGIEAEDVAKK